MECLLVHSIRLLCFLLTQILGSSGCPLPPPPPAARLARCVRLGKGYRLVTWTCGRLALQLSRLQSAKNAKIMVAFHVWPFDSQASECISGTNRSFPPALSASLQRDNYTVPLNSDSRMDLRAGLCGSLAVFLPLSLAL